MRSMQELSFLDEWVKMGHFVYLMFSLLYQKKIIILKRTEISHYFTLRERKKPKLSELTRVFCGLLSLLSKYF